MIHSFTTREGYIRLVPMEANDAERYRILRNENSGWFCTTGFISAKQQAEWYKKYMHNEKEIMFAIYTANGTFVGGNALYDIDRRKGYAKYGRIIISANLSGCGYGFSATKAAMRIAVESLKLRHLELEVFEDNERALSIYLKSGFCYKGFYYIDGRKVVAMECNL